MRFNLLRALSPFTSRVLHELYCGIAKTIKTLDINVKKFIYNKSNKSVLFITLNALPILLASILGCSRSGQLPLKKNLVARTGYYKFGAIILDVKNNSGVVSILIIDSDKNAPVYSENIGQIFSRWYLCWDAADLGVWVYSGDTGSYYIKINNNMSCNKFKINEINNFYIKAMPEEFYDELPVSLKRRWSRYRMSKSE
jgi:hypothetical protein